MGGFKTFKLHFEENVKAGLRSALGTRPSTIGKGSRQKMKKRWERVKSCYSLYNFNLLGQQENWSERIVGGVEGQGRVVDAALNLSPSSYHYSSSQPSNEQVFR